MLMVTQRVGGVGSPARGLRAACTMARSSSVISRPPWAVPYELQRLASALQPTAALPSAMTSSVMPRRSAKGMETG